MILYSPDNTALMEIQSLERSGDELVIKGKVFGTMPITARLTSTEVRKGLKMMRPSLAWFLLRMLVRRSRAAAP